MVDGDTRDKTAKQPNGLHATILYFCISMRSNGQTAPNNVQNEKKRKRKRKQKHNILIEKQ